MAVTKSLGEPRAAVNKILVRESLTVEKDIPRLNKFEKAWFAGQPSCGLPAVAHAVLSQA
jgi:hypothetical protein